MFTRQWLVTVMSDVRYSRGNGLLILIRVTFGQLVRVYLLLAEKIYSCNNRLKRNNISIQGCCHNKRARYECIPRSLSVSDNMTRLKRKKLSIERYCRNKQRARYTCILRYLSVGQDRTHLKRNKLSI